MKNLFFIGLLLLLSACNLPAPAPEVESAPVTSLPSTPGLDATVPVVFSAEALSATPEPPPPYFTEEFDAPSPYWKFLQTGGALAPLTSITSGSLRIDASAPDAWLMGVLVVHSYPNVFVRAKTSLSPTGSTGLICRYNESIGWYEFNAASDGTYNILLGQWLAPGVVKYIPIVSDNSSLLKGNLNREIGLHCQDNLLHLYVNGTLLRRVDVTNYGLMDGNIGVSAASFAEVPMTAIFDWVRIDKE